MVECPTPHLSCDTCPVKYSCNICPVKYRLTKGDIPLVAARTELPDPRPYIWVGRDGAKPSIEIGIKGTF